MSKKFYAAAAAATTTTEVVTPVIETGTEVALVEAAEVAPVIELPVCNIHAELAELDAAADEANNVPVGIRYHLVAAADFKAPRGLATAMLQQFRLTPVATVAEIVTALLASGSYDKVAPQAAALRPRKPVAWQCRQWVNAKVLVVVAAE